jgi:16S rRNA (uracil1498-N3)-methyltransferase
MGATLPAGMTSSIRLHVAAPLAAGATVAATPAQAHYLRAVMRRVVGDRVLLFNGRDGEWDSGIAALGRDTAALLAERQTRAQTPEPDFWLLFAVLKRDATDLVARQATELGVARLQPVLTARTNAERVNTARLAAIAAEAAEQCERLTVPPVAPPLRLAAALAEWPAGRVLHVALERHGAAAPQPVAGPAALLVGPEGGFAPEEQAALLRHPAVRAQNLGPRVLRAETAVVAGLALLLLLPHAVATPLFAPAGEGR